MTDLVTELEELHASGKFYGFSIWRSRGGYQANLGVGINTFRIRHGDTPAEAIDEVFDRRGPLEVLPEREPEILAPPLVDEPPLPDDAGIFD